MSMASKQTTTIRAMYGKTEDRYLDLIRRFPLRPLRTDGDLDAAVAVIDKLIDRAALTPPEQDYLDVLSDLVEAYETETIPMRPVGDAELLRFLIEHKSVTQAGAAQFGLDPPRLRIVVRGSNGSVFAISLGAANPLGLSHYARLDGSREIALLPAFVADAWERTGETP